MSPLRHLLLLALVAGPLVAAVPSPLAGQARAEAERDNPLPGAWILETVDNLTPEGTRVPLYGPSPQGLLVFDQHGTYAIQIMRKERPRFASDNRLQGSDREVREAIEGLNSHFGHYRIDYAAQTITFQIEHASFPNWEGTAQTRPFSLTGDRLTYTVPSPTTGGAVTGEVTWRRVTQ